MLNLTRDPFHLLVSTNYCKNFHQLDVSVDGVPIDSRSLVNVYRKAHERGPYVEVFLFGEDNRIVEQDGKPVTKQIVGDVKVVGTPKTCGCWRGRRVKRWWERINRGLKGW